MRVSKKTLNTLTVFRIEQLEMHCVQILTIFVNKNS
jgi:hypothetical protein